MLSWSSIESGTPADLAAIAEGDGDAGLPHGAEIVAFAEAIGGWDDAALASARARLVGVAGEA
ncbi:MAG TPA: alkylhydroperoxidase-related (seleno)protein, partial [Ilumatobacteraceae bacterium]|nr:alkylhydroperoxidase-related (seleno)protein [Ilumatobacteraceae bacterium]